LILRDARMLVFPKVSECLYTSIAESIAIYVCVYIVVDFPVYVYLCLLLSTTKRFKNKGIMLIVTVIVNVW
jgi:hypothetical protein